MTEKAPERLLALQRRFAGHLRDPDNVPPPEGIEDRRLAIYRRLFFNNLSNLFARNFPVIRKLTSDEDWQDLIRAFMVRHRSHTPMFTEIGGEFVSFMAERVEAGNDQPPWLAELAHWEYLETCVRLDDANVAPPASAPKAFKALLPQSLRINSSLKIAQYQWPVHRIGPKFLPEEQVPVVLAVYRRSNDRVSFMQINALTAALLQELSAESGPTLEQVLIALSEQIQQPLEALQDAAAPLIETLSQREIIQGPR